MSEYLFYDWFLIRQTILRLIQTRGFVINDEPDVKIIDSELTWLQQYQEFNRVHQLENQNIDSLKDVFSKIYSKKKSTEKLFIFFATDTAQSTGKEIVLYFKDQLVATKAKNGVLIFDNKLSPDAGKTIADLENTFHITLYQRDELIICPLQHKDTPQHILLSDEEKTKVMKELRLKNPRDLPLILSTDPIVKFYGWRADNIVKILRYDYYLDILTPHTIQYRYIILPPKT